MKMIKKFSGFLAACGVAALMLMGTQVDAKAMSMSTLMLQRQAALSAAEQRKEAAYDSDLEKSNITIDDFRAWWGEDKITVAYITPEHDLIFFGKTPGKDGYGYETFHAITITEDDYSKMEKSDIEYSFSPIERVDEDFLKEHKDGKVTITSEQDAIYFWAEIAGTSKRCICTDFDKEYVYTLLEDDKVVESEEHVKEVAFVPLFFLGLFVMLLAASPREQRAKRD